MRLTAALAWRCALTLFAGVAPCVSAQALTDPMRPPSVVAGEQGVESEPRTELQSVLISRGRRLAIINGETVMLGGKVGDAKVTRISETEVELTYPDRKEVLKLLDGVARKPVKTAGIKRSAR